MILVILCDNFSMKKKKTREDDLYTMKIQITILFLHALPLHNSSCRHVYYFSTDSEVIPLYIV